MTDITVQLPGGQQAGSTGPRVLLGASGAVASSREASHIPDDQRQLHRADGGGAEGSRNSWRESSSGELVRDGYSQQQQPSSYANFFPDSSFDLGFDPMSISFDDGDKAHVKDQRLPTWDNRTSGIDVRPGRASTFDPGKNRFDHVHTDHNDTGEDIHAKQKGRSSLLAGHISEHEAGVNRNMDISAQNARLDSNSNNNRGHDGALMNDPDTMMKERRGVVKRRSTSKILSHIPATFAEEDEDAEGARADGGGDPASSADRRSAHLSVREALPTVDVTSYQNQPQPSSPPIISQELPLPEPRPQSSVSNQDDAFFPDFDGVHFAPLPLGIPDALASQTQRGNVRPQSQLDKSLVYYPAPVPMMLNLPPRLSHARSGPPPPRPHSLAFPGPVGAPNTNHSSEMAKYPTNAGGGGGGGGGTRNVIATFASILDAAAGAPPSSLAKRPKGQARRAQRSHLAVRPDTIRPIHGDDAEPIDSSGTQTVGANNEAVTDSGRVQSTINLHADGHENPDGALHVRESQMGLPNEPADGNRDGQDAYASRAPSDEGSEYYEDEDEDTLGAGPSTLIAELEARKTEQRLRTKTTPLRFGEGLRSTLLELDAVAEVQRQARKKHATALGWQDVDETREAMDEDVPLGVLYAGALNKQRREVFRQPGLLAKREMEDNEPLSRRRDRLRNAYGLPHPISQVDLLQQQQQQQHEAPVRASTYTLDLPTMDHNLRLNDEDEEREDETLAQRRARLAAAAAFQPPSATSHEDAEGGEEEEEEETLGQRRARLKREQELSITRPGLEPPRPEPKRMVSLSDLLQAAPQRQSYLPTASAAPARGLLSTDLPTGYREQQHQQQQLEMLMQTQVQYPFSQQMQYSYNQPQSQYPLGQQFINNAAYPQPLGSTAQPQYLQPYGGMFGGGQPNYGGAKILNTMHLVQPVMVDQKSRDMVERWRTSVM